MSNISLDLIDDWAGWAYEKGSIRWIIHILISLRRGFMSIKAPILSVPKRTNFSSYFIAYGLRLYETKKTVEFIRQQFKPLIQEFSTLVPHVDFSTSQCHISCSTRLNTAPAPCCLHEVEHCHCQFLSKFHQILTRKHWQPPILSTCL